MSAETTRSSEVSDCGLSPEQKATLDLPVRLCLILTANPLLQETLYQGSELNELLARELALDISDKGSEDAEKLKKAVLGVQHDGLIKFEPQEIEEEVPIIRKDRPTTRTDIIRLMQVAVTPKGLEKLAREIENVSHSA